MKAISLWQPWASALFTSLKREETRSWALPDWAIGVPVAIHAAKRDTREEFEQWVGAVMEQPASAVHFENTTYARLPRGCIIGSVVFGSPVKTELCRGSRSTRDLEWGDYRDGRFAWPVVSRTLYLTPIPCVGRQRFFNWISPNDTRGCGDCDPCIFGRPDQCAVDPTIKL
jgi:hypothetical protein